MMEEVVSMPWFFYLVYFIMFRIKLYISTFVIIKLTHLLKRTRSLVYFENLKIYL